MSLKNTCLSVSMLAALFLGGCAEQAIYELEKAPKEGSEFAMRTAKEYLDLAKAESRIYNSVIDARHFALKGQKAAEGEIVPPEKPSDWDIHPNDMPMVMDIHDRLVFALERGGRIVDSEAAARAQVAFDCWLDELEERIHRSKRVCEKLAMDTLANLETAVFTSGPVRTVMFDYNSAVLDHDSMLIIKEVADRVKRDGDRRVMLVGHTDPIGKAGRNRKLSMNRAMAVKAALLQMGVSKVYIAKTQGRGELKTSRHEVEPKNRHVDIYLY